MPPRCSGVSPASHRRQALPLLTTPESGWLTSCAIEAVSSPMMLTRLMCARSVSSRCNRARSSSARLRSVISTVVPIISTNSPLAFKTGWPMPWTHLIVLSGMTSLYSTSASTLCWITRAKAWRSCIEVFRVYSLERLLRRR